jgi:hypothetical protein
VREDEDSPLVGGVPGAAGRCRLGRGRRGIGQHAGHARGRTGSGRLRLCLRLGADDTVLVVALTGRGNLVHAQLDLDLGGEVAIAQHRAQQLRDLFAQLAFGARLQVEPVGIGTGAAFGQQAAMLVDDADRIGRKPRYRSGDEIDDRGDLAVAKLATGLHLEHDRGAGRGVVAHEDGLLALGKVNADRFHAVDLGDGHLQVAFAGGAQALALQRPAGAHRQLVEHLVAGFGRGQRAVGCDEHAGLVEIALGHGQRAGSGVYIIRDRCLVERGDHAGPLAIVELRIERALRRGCQRAPCQQRAADRGESDKGRDHLLHGGLAGECGKPRQHAAAGRIGERREHRAGGGKGGSGRAVRSGGNEIGHCLSDPHAHDVLVGGQQLVANLQGRLEGDARFLAGQHDLGDICHLAALVGFGQSVGPGLDGVDAVEGGLERVGKALRGCLLLDHPGCAGALGALSGMEVLEQVVALDDLLAHRHDLLDAASTTADAGYPAHRRPPMAVRPISMPASRSEARR